MMSPRGHGDQEQPGETAAADGGMCGAEPSTMLFIYSGIDPPKPIGDLESLI